MIITDIRPRRKGLSQLYIDGEPAVKIDTETLSISGYCAGDEITDEDLHELIQSSNRRRAKEKALYLLEYKNRSKKELENKIAAAQIPREAAREAAERMEELGLVDDDSYARSLAKQLFEVKKYGKMRVKQELFQKGIDRFTIEDVLEEYEDFDSISNITEILIKKYPDFDEDEKIKRRAIAALQRYGYSYDEIKTAMNECYDE